MANEIFFKVVKAANMIAGLGFVAFVGVWMIINLYSFNGDDILFNIYTFFLPFFFVFFGMLLIVAEFYKEFVKQYFSFLQYFLGRGLFNIFLATQTGYFGTFNSGNFIGEICSWVLLVLGFVYIFLHFIKGSIAGDAQQSLLS